MTTATTKRKPKAKLVQKMDPWETPVPFTENFKFPGANRRITFEAESFRAWVKDCRIPGLNKLTATTSTRATVKEKLASGINVGNDYWLYLRLLPLVEMASPRFRGFSFMPIALSPRPTRCTLEVFQRTTAADVAFSAAVEIPVLCDADGEPWMSLTPNEIFTQRGQLRRAKVTA